MVLNARAAPDDEQMRRRARSLLPALAVLAVVVTQLLVALGVAWSNAQAGHAHRYEWFWTPAWLIPEVVLVAGYVYVRSEADRQHRSRTTGGVVVAALVLALVIVPLLSGITDGAVMNGVP
jgi:chromate transport protein ChrA